MAFGHDIHRQRRGRGHLFQQTDLLALDQPGLVAQHAKTLRMQQMNERHFLVVPAGDDHDLSRPLRDKLLQIIGTAIDVQRPARRVHRAIVEGVNQAHEVVHVRSVFGEDMNVVVDQRMALAQRQRGVEVARVEDDQGMLLTHRPIAPSCRRTAGNRRAACRAREQCVDQPMDAQRWPCVSSSLRNPRFSHLAASSGGSPYRH